MSKEEILYIKALKQVNAILKIGGAYFEEEAVNRTMAQRFFSRKFYCFNMFWLFLHIIGEILWAIDGLRTGESIVKLTFLIPGLVLSILGTSKSYYLVRNENLVTELITTIKSLQSDCAKSEVKPEVENEVNKRMVVRTSMVYLNNMLYGFGFSLCVIAPFVISLVIYQRTGKVELLLPFLAKFPFDEKDIRFWPIAYLHQIWSAVIAIAVLHGPDCFYSLSCVVLYTQFKILQYDAERIIPQNADFTLNTTQDAFKKQLKNIVQRHLKLIRCVVIVEQLYSKSTILNVAVSSIVICISAFNVTVNRDQMLFFMIFLAFLCMYTMQVFILCYYGDLLIESSSDLSNALYRSNWYILNSTLMKDSKFILTRCQKPCKLTAYGFADLNLRLLAKLMRLAWSYFALLQTVYNK